MTSEVFLPLSMSPRLTAEEARALRASFHVLKSRELLLIERWSERYVAARRGGVTSLQRLRSGFERVVHTFLKCLHTMDWETYCEELRKIGKNFSDLGAPFEEVIFCIYLFESSCLEIVLEDALPDDISRDSLRIAYDELAKMGSACIAVSYFHSVKAEWGELLKNYREENEMIRKTLVEKERDLFTKQNENLKSLDTLVSNISRKVLQQSRKMREVYRMSTALQKAKTPIDAVRIAAPYFLKRLPSDVECMIGLMDEFRQKFQIYSVVDKDCHFVGEVRYGNLIPEYRQRLSGFDPGVILRKEVRDPASVIFPLSKLKTLKEFMILPLSWHWELLGLIWIGSPRSNIFTTETAKTAKRLSQPLTTVLFGLDYYARQRKNETLALTTQESPQTAITKDWESALDQTFTELIRALGVERVSFMRYRSQDKLLTMYAAKGYRVYPFDGLRLKWGEGIAGAALRDSKIICISQIRNSGVVKHPPIKSLACVPVHRDGLPVGVLNLSTITHYKQFDSAEVKVASQIANRLSNYLTYF